jgi:hypothetical protein
MAWLLQQAEALAAQPHPDQKASAELAIRFSDLLEACPGDFLEALIASPFGRVFRLFLERCSLSSYVDQAADQRKQQLSQQLRHTGFQDAEGHGLLLALMPFYPPGNLKVEDAAAKLPGWLLELYRLRYDPPTAGMPAMPSGDPNFHDRIFLNRLLGLANLYYIDPDDQEILQEVREIRLQTIQLLLSVDRENLGRHFSEDFGDRYWALAQSGLQKEPLDANESAQKETLQQWLSKTPNSLHSEGGIQRFAAVLLFNPPGSVGLAQPEKNLPAWFLDGFRRYSSMAVAA